MKFDLISHNINSVNRLFTLVLTVMIFASNLSINDISIDYPVLIFELQDNNDNQEESENNSLEEDLFLTPSNRSTILTARSIRTNPVFKMKKSKHFRRIPSPPPEVC